MITGKREVTGIELHMTRDEARDISMSLRGTANLLRDLVATDQPGRARPGSLIEQLPNDVITAIKASEKYHIDMSYAITDVLNGAVFTGEKS